MINNRICRDYWLLKAETVYREHQQHLISVWHCWKYDYMQHKLAIKVHDWVPRVADIDHPSELSADTTCSFCAVNPSLCRCNRSPAVYPAEWSCTLGGCVTDSRPSCLAGLVGDIPSVFTHRLRSASVFLSLWPQHKQLHPQINKTQGGGHGPGAAGRNSSVQLKRRLFVFTCVHLQANVCVHNWKWVGDKWGLRFLRDCS